MKGCQKVSNMLSDCVIVLFFFQENWKRETVFLRRRLQRTEGQAVQKTMKIRRKKGYTTMILPEGAKEYEEVENPKNYNEKLVQAFAKAYKWQKMLKEK